MIPPSTASSPSRHGRRAAHLAIALTILPFLTFCGGGGYTLDDGVLVYRYPPCETHPSYPVPTPALALRVHVLLDSSGMTPDQVAGSVERFDQEIDKASAIYAPSGISLEFDPSADATPVVEGLPTGPLDAAKTEILNVWGLLRPGRIVLIFRKDNTTGPQSSLSWSFVDLPRGDFEGRLYAHEIGHYLGLRHTFSETCDTLPFATTACCDFTKPGCNKTDPVQSPAGSTPTWRLPTLIRDEVIAVWGPVDTWSGAVRAAALQYGFAVRDEFLDGDGLDDTPPALWATTGDGDIEDCAYTVGIPVQFSDRNTEYFDFKPCTWNPMSYYFRCSTSDLWFSSSQTNIMRSHLLSGVRRTLLP